MADYAFFSCKNLQTVALPDPVEMICTLAFGACPNLVSAEMGDGPRTVTGRNHLVNICLPTESRTTRSRVAVQAMLLPTAFEAAQRCKINMVTRAPRLH